jgi:hypothetical protein
MLERAAFGRPVLRSGARRPPRRGRLPASAREPLRICVGFRRLSELVRAAARRRPLGLAAGAVLVRSARAAPRGLVGFALAALRGQAPGKGSPAPRPLAGVRTPTTPDRCRFPTPKRSGSGTSTPAGAASAPSTAATLSLGDAVCAQQSRDAGGGRGCSSSASRWRRCVAGHPGKEAPRCGVALPAKGRRTRPRWDGGGLCRAGSLPWRGGVPGEIAPQGVA